ncbi:MAG: hypothetical protein J7J22_04410 [Candidatus Verstraetearchaeota archaeon]|nr:hypothetical protein [Candidatus Verstraetearchaeota archaeon]
MAMTLDWRIKCLILHGKNDDEILRLLRGVKFNSTIIRERIKRGRRKILQDVLRDLLLQGYGLNDILMEVSQCKECFENIDLSFTVRNFMESHFAVEPSIKPASLKKLIEMFSEISRGKLFISMEQRGLIFSLKIYGDRAPPMYCDLEISIEKYDAAQRSLLIRFLDGIKEFSSSDFKKEMIKLLKLYGGEVAKFDILTLVMKYIDDDMRKYLLNGMGKEETMKKLRLKYSGILDKIMRVEGSLSPVDREFRKAWNSIMSDDSLIFKEHALRRIGTNRFIIETPRCYFPNYSLDIAVLMWTSDVRDLLLNLFHTLAVQGLKSFHKWINEWLEKLISRK